MTQLNTTPLPPLTKQVCQLDSDGIYITQTEADLDLMANDGSYLLPAGCIDVEPPELREGFAAQWQDNQWHYLEDHRGHTAYSTDDGQAQLVTEVGALPEALTLMPRPDMYHTWHNGAWVMTAENKKRKLADLKADKQQEINRAAETFIKEKAAIDQVPEFERATWRQQQQEALAWSENPEAATPMLEVIAQNRGIDLNTLRAAALRKTQAFTLLSASVAGQRQAYVDQLNAAQSIEEIEAIEVAYQVGAGQ